MGQGVTALTALGPERRLFKAGVGTLKCKGRKTGSGWCAAVLGIWLGFIVALPVGAQEEQEAPVLPVGLSDSSSQEETPALPAGLSDGSSAGQEEEPALPAGLGGEQQNGENLHGQKS